MIGSYASLTNLPAPRPTVKKSLKIDRHLAKLTGKRIVAPCWTDKGQWYDGFMSPCTFVRNIPDVQDE